MLQLYEPINYSSFRDWRLWIAITLAGAGVSLGMTWLATGKVTINDWFSSLVIFFIGAGLLFLSLYLLRGEKPQHWLGFLLAGAVLIRLLAGVIWYTALPVLGHGSEEESAGYVMADAAKRDTGAYQLAQSEQPLWSAFSKNRRIDQYGGMLFLSAFTYRYLGGSGHNPLSILLLTAFISSAAVLFLWAFSRRAWGDIEARMGAVFLAVYPEAVLLGSTQMREAFTITLTMAGFYGLLLFFRGSQNNGLVWMSFSLMFGILLSPPYAALLFAMLVIAALPLRKALSRQQKIPTETWAVVIGIAALVLLGSLWWALGRFVPEGINNPAAALSWWFNKSIGLQAHITRLESGWTQQVFRIAPEWSHLPLLVAYGTLQPFLPAALVAGSHAPIWRWIGIWRAAGWSLLLPLLVYAPIRAFKERKENRFTLVLSVLVWAGILFAAVRGGGDLWDNPRYRASFAGLQIALASWALAANLRSSDHWLRRIYISMLITLCWFVPWYLFRYYGFPWPIEDFFTTAALGILTSLLYIIWDWKRRNQQAA